MKHFFVALQFLTRLKLVRQEHWSIEDFGLSVPYFTLVGYIIGGASALVYWGLQPVLGLSLTALLVVTFQFLFTGGLHADGYMDTCDGLFSGRERERKLEIMKDSRVGANGVVGFVFLVLLKWQLLAAICPELAIPFLILLSACSKQGLTMSVRMYPYARPEGMGKAFAMYSPKESVIVATLFLLMGMGAVAIFIGGDWIFYALIILLAALFANRELNRYMVKHLGGVTGDTYGFVSEVTELWLLFIFILASRFVAVW